MANNSPIPADKILDEAKKTITARINEYDRGGERCMPLAVQIFNAITGEEMTERYGRIFMLSVKIARSMQGKGKLDTYVDMAGEAALLGECALAARTQVVEDDPK